MAKDQRGNDVPERRYNDAPEKAEIKSKWWAQKEEDMHQHVFGVVNKIKEYQGYRSLNNLRFARLYSNMEITALTAGLFNQLQNPHNFLTNLISFNVIKACIDTAASKIAKARPRPMFLTDDGEWEMQNKAQLMTRYFEGLFDTMGTGQGDNRTLYGLKRRGFVDSGIFGTGATKFFADETERTVKAERVLIEEIIVDDTEGMYEQPRQLHQEKMVFREVLADMFPAKADEIMRAKSLIGQADSRSAADMLKVYESWHLPSGEKAGDGKKAICIDGATLRVDDWKRDYFPFVFQRWNPRVLGFYGQGIAEELLPIQLEISKMLRTIAIAQHLMSVPQVWLELQNQTIAKHIDNSIGGVKFYTGAPPNFLVPTAMSAEVYQHLENLYNKAFSLVGISQMTASAAKPAGLNAAVALREWSDIESDRFSLTSMRYQDCFMESTNICMDLLEDLEKKGHKPSVRVADSDFSTELRWADVCVARDKLKIRAFPTDLLPSTPSGKMQSVQEMMQAGFFDREESLELLDFPDVRAVTSLKTAGRSDIRKMLSQMVETGDYLPPEPYMGLQTARNLAQAYYLRGKLRGMPEHGQELLRRFMDDCQDLILKGSQPQAPGAPGAPAAGGGAADAGNLAADQSSAQAIAAGGPPIAQPQAQPTSDLLPVAAGA